MGGPPGTHDDRTRRVVAPRTAGAIAAAFLLTAALVSVSLVRVTGRRAIDQDVRENLVRVASTLAAAIDPDAHAALTDPAQEDSDDYRRLCRPLQRMLRETPGVRFAYTLREVDGRLHFVLDGSPVGDADGDGVEDHSFLMDVYEDPDPAAWKALRTRSFVVTDEPYEDQWGRFLSGYAPLLRADGSADAVVGVDVSAQEYERRMASIDHAAMWAMLPAVLIALAGGRAVWWAARRARQHAEEIESHRLRTEEAYAAKSRLVANLSHELRTPLTAVMGFAEIAFEKSNPDAERAEARSTVRRNCEHLIALLNDLLDLSKAEAGAIEIETAEVSVGELVRGSVAPLRHRATAKGIDLTIEQHGAVPSSVLLDPIRVRQVLLNLIGNAVKFTDRGGVRVVVDAGDGVLRFRVEDTGPGLSEAQRAALFRPFAQVGGSAEKKSEGAGLGLALCQKLLALMDGSIRVESTPGVGTVFTVTLPLVEPERATPAASVSSDTGGQGSLAGRRVLLAEDGEDNRRLIRFILTRAGAEVMDYPDGRAALDAVAGGVVRPDIVLTDWDMPVLDGAGLVRGLRAAGWRGPIVSLTAHAMKSQESECLAAGCDAHLTKPIDWGKLTDICAALIGSEDRRAA